MKAPIFFSILSSFALGFTLPTSASGTPARDNGEQAGSKDKSSEKKICKRDKPPTGSRLPTKRICKTQAEWEQHALETSQGS